MYVSLTESPLQIPLIRNLSDKHGCSLIFTGVVRNHNNGEIVTWVEYSAHKNLALVEMESIVQEAEKTWESSGIRCSVAHRLGRLCVGDISLIIQVDAEHREESYLASRFILEQIKQRVPIWKKESYQSGMTKWLPGVPLTTG